MTRGKAILSAVVAIAVLMGAALYERHHDDMQRVDQLKAATTGASDPRLAP